MGKPEVYEQDDAIIGRAFVASLAVIASIVILGAGIYFFANSGEMTIETNESPLELPQVRNVAKIDYPAVSFTDVTKEWGIDFVHVNGANGAKLLPETMGSGCAAVDYDGDGDIDLLFVNSQSWEADANNSATMKLFRNDDGHYHDVTAEVGLDVSLYGMGVAVGDIENDGDLDIFITAVGTNRLFVQQDGKFVDATDSAGVAGAGEWSTSCGFLDYDRDGLLDLFVCNYLEWSQKLDAGQKFRLAGVGRAYGPPSAFVGTFPILYHNEGNGTFRDVSIEAGVQVKNNNTTTKAPVAKSLGVATVDMDQDGWIDILVANDTVRNFLFHNQRDGTFREVGTQAGIAFNSAGKARGAMGIDVDYVRDNGQLAVGIGNYSNESSALYVKQSSQLLFLDEATSTGFGPPTRLALTFGLFFFDVDLDGRLDIFGANGHLENEIEKVQESQKYAQQPHLFWNRGPGNGSNEFVKVPASVTGKAFASPVVGRGAVSADLDGDGDLDLVITQCGRRAKVLRNDQNLGRNWVRIRAIGNGTSSNRDAIGATLEAHVSDRVVRRVISRTRSYLSQSEATVTLGIGQSKQVERIKIVWPDGTTQEHAEPIEAGTTLTIEQR